MPIQGRHALSYLLHSSQQLVLENDAKIYLYLTVYDNHELRMKLLSHGPNVEVLPVGLRDRLRRQHMATAGPPLLIPAGVQRSLFRNISPVDGQFGQRTRANGPRLGMSANQLILPVGSRGVGGHYLPTRKGNPVFGHAVFNVQVKLSAGIKHERARRHDFDNPGGAPRQPRRLIWQRSHTMQTLGRTTESICALPVLRTNCTSRGAGKTRHGLPLR